MMLKFHMYRTVRLKDVCESRALVLIPIPTLHADALRMCSNLGGQLATEPLWQNFEATVAWIKSYSYHLPWRAGFKKNLTARHHYNIYTKEVDNLTWSIPPDYSYADWTCVYFTEAGFAEDSCEYNDNNVICDLHTAQTFEFYGLKARSKFDTRYRPVNTRSGLIWAGNNNEVFVRYEKNVESSLTAYLSGGGQSLWKGKSFLPLFSSWFQSNASQPSLMIGNHYIFLQNFS